MEKERIKIFIIALALILLIIAPAISNVSRIQIDHNKNTAIVNQIDNIYVFINCVPSSEYERIGMVAKHFAVTGGNTEMINGLVKKAKKEYSQAEGIIFTSFDFEKCEVIKFKK